MEVVAEASFGLDDATAPSAARINNIRQWRQVAVRADSARKFRTDVRRSYDDTCLFSGQRLPKLRAIASAGVDAAHILPWSSFDLDCVSNGLCLSKQCHWAFDSGLIRLTYESTSARYIIDIPNKVKDEAKSAQFHLEYFSGITGVIPESRLPKSKNSWPNPNYLNEFNRIMFQ